MKKKYSVRDFLAGTITLLYPGLNYIQGISYIRVTLYINTGSNLGPEKISLISIFLMFFPLYPGYAVPKKINPVFLSTMSAVQSALTI